MVRATYTKDDFAAPPSQCDLVMKGGVTSGIVYPYAILELAKAYRFRSIGGTSAGAIAAAFAAAAEYARQNGDPTGFLRLQGRCEALPGMLAKLFQPEPRFAPLMRMLLAAQAGRWLQAVFVAFWAWLALSVALGVAIGMADWGGPLAGVLGAVVLFVTTVVARLLWYLKDMSMRGFGLCPGLTQPGGQGPGLTDWIHASLQDIAFGPAGRAKPLTFGDLVGADPDHPDIDLRMVTTNLSLRRPHTLPRFNLEIAYEPNQWKALFPADVLQHMASATQTAADSASLPMPQAADMPVLVAVRMSLSFPFLFKAIPALIRDVESAGVAAFTGASGAIQTRQCWFSDGGISSNFPIHMFDALLPSRPTFALSLDDLPEGAKDNGPRVYFPGRAASGAGAPIHPIEGLSGFALSLFNAASNWQDQLQSAMPGFRDRIARVYLTKTQGGLNLTMPPATSQALMGYGREVGAGFAGGRLNFDDHRYIRALIAYGNLEKTITAFDESWNAKGYGAWFQSYMATAAPYAKVGKAARTKIHTRLGGVASLSQAFQPLLYSKSAFPNPIGRLRVAPEY